MPRFKKGVSGNPNGRPLGSRNKLTLAAAQAIDAALNYGKGAVDFLVGMRDSRVASDRAAFCHLVGKRVPRDVDIDLPHDAPSIVRIYLPHNDRGPRPGESIEQFRARIGQKSSNDK